MRSIVITFGIIILCSIILLQMGKVAYINNTLPVEVIIGFFSFVFLIVGILITRRPRQSVIVVPQQVPPAPQTPAPEPESGLINHDKINALGISKREYEILCEVALGLSNTEIASKLFVSESTVKTHVSNLLAKLDAKRRTEAVRIAKELKIIN